MAPKRKPSKTESKAPSNGVGPAIPEDAIWATMEDFAELVKANPSLQLPLTNIVQKRLLAEKDAEIARLTAEVAAKDHSEPE